MTKWKASEVFINNEHNRMMIHEDKWGGKPIADCGITLSNESKKNARLIAAAPELLEALEAILSPLVNNNHDGMELWKSDDQYHNAVAAIAKAKGA